MSDNTQIPEDYKPIDNGITLYTLGTPNGVKVSVALELLGLKYKAYNIDISTNIQKEPWFLKHVNPNGRIPAIIDNTGSESVAVFESGAILVYLTTKYDKEHKLSYEIGTKEYFETFEWLFFQNAGVGPMQGQANHFKLYNNDNIKYAIKRYLDETRRLYSVLETRLKESKSGWLVGDHISIADVTTVGWVTIAYPLEIDVKKEFPTLGKWAQKVINVPGVEAGLNATSTYRPFTTDAWAVEK